jgi:glycosyltransferase involved in cell wall biosynthesis
MSAEETITVSIVVACRNEAKAIRPFLESLTSQEMADLPWEVLIADGLSDDGTRETLEQYAATNTRLRVISNPGRIVSTGLNAAIRAARGEIIIRLDAHTVYAGDYCRRCVEELERTKADNVGGPARTRAEGIRARAVAAAYHSPLSTGGGRFHDVSYEGWVDTVPYGCWHKATLERIGLFDEALVRNQDDELNLRLARAGGKIWQSPSIKSWYSPRPRLSALFRQYFQYGFWKVAVIRKHSIPASWRHLVPIAFVLANASFLVAMAVAKLAGASQWFSLCAEFWSGILAIYVLCLLCGSVITAMRSGWDTLPYLPATFATYHLSYGLGFLLGLRWYFVRPVPAGDLSPAFTQISR